MHFIQKRGHKMTNNDKYEKLHLISGINPILPEIYPVSFPLHWHQYIEIMALPYYAVLSISPTIIISNVEYKMMPGDIVIAWSGELHEIIDNTDKQLIALQFPVNTITEIQDFVPYLNSFRSVHLINKEIDIDLSHNIHAHLNHMLSHKRSNQLFCDIEILICLYELFITFGSYIYDKNKNSINNDVDCPRHTLTKMNQACNYINEHCEQNISLDDLAKQFGFSSYYFSRTFKAATSFNFTEYLALQRVKRAQTYLAESDMNITEIAFSSGFKSIASFNRAFKQFRGCAPRDYRKYHTKE